MCRKCKHKAMTNAIMNYKCSKCKTKNEVSKCKVQYVEIIGVNK